MFAEGRPTPPGPSERDRPGSATLTTGGTATGRRVAAGRVRPPGGGRPTAPLASMLLPTFDPTLAPPGVTASTFLSHVRMPEAGRSFLRDLVRRRLLDAAAVGGFLQQV